MWKILCGVASVVVAAWAVDARYALSDEMLKAEARVAKVETVQKQIADNQEFFLEDKKAELEIQQFQLERKERTEIEEFQYQQNMKRLGSIDKQLGL